jgi:hypothetical protein
MANHYEKLENLKQAPGGSLYEYLYEFISITSKVSHPDKSLEIKLFIDGLSTNLREECRYHGKFANFLELELFVKAAYLASKYPHKARVCKKPKKRVRFLDFGESAV